MEKADLRADKAAEPAGAVTDKSLRMPSRPLKAVSLLADLGTVKDGADRKRRAEHRKEAEETLAVLYKEFPRAFIAEGPCLPLKIGIFKDLRDAAAGREDLSPHRLRLALRTYTSQLRYLRAVMEGAARVDLGGEGGEAVSAEHAADAAQRLAEIKERIRQRRERNKERRRPRPLAEQGDKDRQNTDGAGASEGGKDTGLRGPGFRDRRRRDERRRDEHRGDGAFKRREDGRGPRHGSGARDEERERRASDERRARSHGPKQAPADSAPDSSRITTAPRLRPSRQADQNELKSGLEVLVSSGTDYLPATVTAVKGDGTVRLELASGLALSVPRERVWLA